VAWTRYRIQPGDALLSIARRHQTTVDVLRSVNQLNGNLIRAGDYLLIPTARASTDTYALSPDNRLAYIQNQAPSANLEPLNHTVQSGESFWLIARRYGVEVQELARWNRRGVNEPIRVGERLVVWQNSSTPSTPTQLASRTEVRPVGYTVRSGDSLALIASQFNVSVNDIRQWNASLNGDLIFPGQRLRVYVNVTQAP
jgi:membrane-bound lytic murein transglycosylase D